MSVRSHPDVRWAARLTWPELKALASGSDGSASAVALLPVGSTEAHGPHLPLSVDVVIAEEVCARTALTLQARGTPAVIFPAVTYALTDFAAPFSGTVSLPAASAQALLEGVLGGIAAQRFSTVVCVNHHLEPAHFQLVHAAAKAVAARGLSRIVVPDHRRKPVGPMLGEEFMHGGSHAGRYETSLMLAAAPELVRDDVRAGLPELAVDLPARIKAGAKDFLDCGGEDAYFGAPAAATAEEGERLLAVLVEATVAVVTGS